MATLTQNEENRNSREKKKRNDKAPLISKALYSPVSCLVQSRDHAAGHVP